MSEGEIPFPQADFPADFVWGVATSAFQIEGAAHSHGRGDSVWDVFCRRPGAIADGSNGDVACDHYHRLDADLDLLAGLGIPAYRFSLAWPRLQPDGLGDWNQEGLDFYDRLIDGLAARGISAHLTLFHWDLPQILQERGGWASRETVAAFVSYARVMCERYGNRVATIATHNEPWVVAHLGHGVGTFAPGIRDVRVESQVAHHLLLSHGLAIQAMRACRTRARLGIVLNQAPIHPATPSDVDSRKARIEDGLLVRRFMDPLLLGRYPVDVMEHLGADGPEVAPGDMEAIASPIDFLGINYYTRVVVSGDEARDPEPIPPLTDMGWEIFPDGLRDLLVRLHRDYRLPPILITENGAAFPDRLSGGEVRDPERVDYLRRHIESVGEARRLGVDVRGYFVWTFLDNFEWIAGYAKRFGIVYVDYPSLRRIPKSSARWFKEFVARQACRVVAP